MESHWVHTEDRLCMTIEQKRGRVTCSHHVIVYHSPNQLTGSGAALTKT